MDSHIPARQTPIRSISVSLKDVKQIFERLEKIVREEGRSEVSKLVKPSEPPDFTDDQWAARKSEIEAAAFRVTVTVEGRNGDRLYQDSSSIFDSPSLPQLISSIYMTNLTAFRGWTKSDPVRQFELYFDFSKPKLVDGEHFVSSPTPNQSNLKIQADSDSWVAAVHEAVFGVLQHKSVSRKLLHRAFIYDWGLMLIGIPCAFYAANKASRILPILISSDNEFLRAAFYVYVMLTVVWGYRILFGYTKWIFPSVELKESSSSTFIHRAIWGGLILGLAVNFLYDILKSF